MTNNKVTATIDIGIPETTLNKCLRILEIWLEEHPDKTIMVEQEDGVRVCLVHELEELDEAD